jgi:DNA-binding transcriptional LysR family regulator
MVDMTKRVFSEVDLGELRVLDTLLREGSITRAAQALDTSQPAVSRVLRRLRARFADPLVVRDGRGVQPTARALEMAAQVRFLLETADSLHRELVPFDPGTSDRQFSLLLTDVGMVRFLPPLVAVMATKAPRVRIRAVPLDSRHFELKLETGEADLALGAFPAAAGYLRRQRLFSDTYVSVVRKGHPRVSRLRSRSGFLGERHILTTASETGHAAHVEAQRVLTGEILPANIVLRVPSFVAGAIVASQTEGVVTLPKNLADIIAGPLGLVAFRTPLQLPKIDIAQYWHERYHRDGAHQWIRSVIFDSFAANGR